MIIIPEFILLHTVTKAIKLIKQDLLDCEAGGRVEESYLFRVFGDNMIERYQYFEQMRDILLKKKDDPRLLNIDLMYNMAMDKVPSIYITLPGEQHSSDNAVAMETDEEYYTNQNGDYVQKYTRRKEATYAIYIVSDNSNEVNLIYHFIDSIILSATPALALSGLYNLRQGGQDIQLENDKIPKHFFIKALSLGMSYKKTAPEFHKNIPLGELVWKGTPTNPDEY